MARVPKNVVAVTPGGNITMEQVLGWLCMFSVPDQPVSLGKVLREFKARDLDTSFLPEKRIPVNVFQKACGDVRTGRRPENGKEIEADQIYEDAHTCVYQITLKLRDRRPRDQGGTERIEFEKSMRVRFLKESSTIDVEPMEADAYRQLATLESDIRDKFDKNAKMLPGGKVRAALRSYMRVMDGTNVLSRSGAYFIPKGWKKGKETEPKQTLEVLAEVLEKLYGDKATIWTVPLANAGPERDMVGNTFVQQVDDMVMERIAKLSDVLKRDPKYIRKDLIKNTVQDRKEMGELYRRYSELLGDRLEEVQYKLDLYTEQMDKLFDKASELGTDVDV